MECPKKQLNRPRATTQQVSAAILALGLLAVAGCSSSAPGSATGTAATGSGSCKNVAYLINNISNPWISTMAEGGEARGKEIGATVKVQDANLDTATQISQIQQAIANKVDGILLQSVEADGVVPAVQQANAAGIPVVAVNSGVGDGANVVSYVGVDQTNYGKGLAELAMKALPNGGKVAIIQGVVGNPVEVQRTQGATDALKASGKVDVVATVSDSWSNDKNLAAVQDLLNRYPKGQLDAIIAEGPQIYVGADYAKSIGRTDVKFIAGDYPVQVRDAITAGTVYGTVLQDGAQQGAAGVDALCNWVQGQKDKVKQPTDFVEMPLVTKDNVGEYKTSWNW
ncbi:sugar ABC transporter substrate-binding protein [Arthrobacter sp. NPDC056691]|uniref:sugar ABC transporter substrate-binding protein n=1 Tax=Arthrobacter sp. NPDC056691 TaxID=3345913 RepID=UPI00366C8F62